MMRRIRAERALSSAEKLALAQPPPETDEDREAREAAHETAWREWFSGKVAAGHPRR
jgi:hypothetical protein